MIAFHRALVHRRAATPPDVGHALQLAAREIMRTPRYRHPFYWAAFRTVGLGY
jgi:CHAT domain-containing protein